MNFTNFWGYLNSQNKIIPPSSDIYLEVEDSGISVAKVLIVGHDSAQGFLLEGQRGDGCQKPAVP